MKKILYADKSEFLRSMIELAFKGKNEIELHTIDSLTNNLYLLDDLKPDLVIFDRENKSEDLFIYAKKSGAKLIHSAIENNEDSEISFLKKPLIAKSIVATILSFLE